MPKLDFRVAQYTALQGLKDPALLARAAEAGRILITHDFKTIPKYVYERLGATLPVPGVIAVPDTMPIGQAIEELALLLVCSAAREFENQVRYLPL